MLCDMLCDCGHIPLHHLRNTRKEKVKSKKIDKRKTKEKENIRVQVL